MLPPYNYTQQAWNKKVQERMDTELEEAIARFRPAPPCPVWLQAMFPFMMIYYRKKISVRNTNYLIATPIYSYAELNEISRNLKHKGWPFLTNFWDIPAFMFKWKTYNRYCYLKIQNWEEAERILSAFDRHFIPDMNEKFPCPPTSILEKKTNQYKLIF